MMAGRTRVLTVALAVAALSLASTPAAARDLPTETIAQGGLSPEGVARLDAGMEGFVRSGSIPGAVVLLARNGRVAHYKAFGVSDRDTKRPMQVDDIFRIYSMTKPVIAVALLMEYEKGKFRLDDPLEKYLPAFKDVMVYAGEKDGKMLLEKPKRKPTIHDVLRHTSGIGTAGGPPLMAKAYYDQHLWLSTMDSLDEEMKLLGNVPLYFQPGEAWLYGYNVDVQAALVQHFSGMKIDDYLRTQLFEPLGMDDTGYSVPADKRGRIARLHDVPEGDPPMPAMDMRPSVYERFGQHPFGTIGLWSTAMDYARFAQMLANGGSLDGRRILSRKTVELMTQNNLPPAVGDIAAGDAIGRGWGLGLAVSVNPGLEGMLGTAGAFGWDGAATTRFIVDPKEHFVAVFMGQKAPMDGNLLDLFQVLAYQSIGD